LEHFSRGLLQPIWHDQFAIHRRHFGEVLESLHAIAPASMQLRVADRLGISQKVLALVIGLSESTISRMRKGLFTLARGNSKAFELAQLLVRLYNLLDCPVRGPKPSPSGEGQGR
jgi:DNA-binding XRE family transcriptional regulator